MTKVKKIMNVIAKIFMEALTCGYIFYAGMVLDVILWEYTSWSGYEEEMGWFALLTYMVVRYQSKRMLEKVNKD